MVIGFKLHRLPKAMYTFLKTPWLCCDPPRHLHSFNPKNINLLLQKNGLNAVRIFTEYSISQYYSPRKYENFKVQKPGDVVKIVFNLLAQGGIKFLRLIDKRNTWGSNVVVYAHAAD